MDSFTEDWTTDENKAFEEALAEVDLNSSSWFENLTTRFPNKTPEQLREHYTDLVVDIESIESGYFSNPIYTDPWAVKMATEMEDLSVIDLPYSPDISGTGSPYSGIGLPEKKVEEENLMSPVYKGANEGMLSEETMMKMVLPEAQTEIRNGKRIPAELANVVVAKRMAGELEASPSSKGKAWTEEEHRLFLAGLNIHGKGAWRSIAKNIVHTRTSTQVASHAQKYFSRQLDKRQRRKRSILDITSIPETTEPHREIMCDSVDTKSQTQLNNAN